MPRANPPPASGTRPKPGGPDSVETLWEKEQAARREQDQVRIDTQTATRNANNKLRAVRQRLAAQRRTDIEQVLAPLAEQLIAIAGNEPAGFLATVDAIAQSLDGPGAEQLARQLSRRRKPPAPADPELPLQPDP